MPPALDHCGQWCSGGSGGSGGVLVDVHGVEGGGVLVPSVSGGYQVVEVGSDARGWGALPGALLVEVSLKEELQQLMG